MLVWSAGDGSESDASSDTVVSEVSRELEELDIEESVSLHSRSRYRKQIVFMRQFVMEYLH